MQKFKIKLYENLKNGLATYNFSTRDLVVNLAKFRAGDASDEAWFANQIYGYLASMGLSFRDYIQFIKGKDSKFNYLASYVSANNSIDLLDYFPNLYSMDLGSISLDKRKLYILNPFKAQGISIEQGFKELGLIGFKSKAFKNPFCVGINKLINLCEYSPDKIKVGIFTGVDMWTNPIYKDLLNYFKACFSYNTGYIFKDNSLGYSKDILFSVWESHSSNKDQNLSYYFYEDKVFTDCQYSLGNSLSFNDFKNLLLRGFVNKKYFSEGQDFNSIDNSLFSGMGLENLDFIFNLGLYLLIKDYTQYNYYTVKQLKNLKIRSTVKIKEEFKIEVLLYLIFQKKWDNIKSLVKVKEDLLKGAALDAWSLKDEESINKFKNSIMSKISYFLEVEDNA